MKKSKRLFSVILIVSMLIGVLPSTVFAVTSDDTLETSGANASTVILACSDVQDPNNSYLFNTGNYTAQNSLFNNIISKIKSFYPTVTDFFCGGDYNFDITREGSQYVENGVQKVYTKQKAVETTLKDAMLLSDTIQSIFPAVTDDRITMIQGNHDEICYALTPSGGYDEGTYSVYVINEKDYPAENKVPAGSGFSSAQALCQNTANNLRTWLDGLVKANYNKPVFILTHVPLHFSNRTVRKGDATYAQYIYDAIESHGNDLNIIFIYGHDHSAGDDDFLGGAAQFLTRGDKLTIAKAGSTNVSRALQKTLNFTYMNYGFVGYFWDVWDAYSGTINYNVDHTLTMTTFEINGSDVIVRRWDQNGQHILKAVGAKSLELSAADVLPPNTKSYASPQTVKSPKISDDDTDKIQTFIDNATGVSVKAIGTGLTVTSKSNVPALANAGITDFKAFDISVAKFSGEAEITMPVKSGYNKVWRVKDNGELEEIKNAVFAGNTVKFTTSYLGVYAAGQASGLVNDTYYWVQTPIQDVKVGDVVMLVASNGYTLKKDSSGAIVSFTSYGTFDNKEYFTPDVNDPENYAWLITSNGIQSVSSPNSYINLGTMNSVIVHESPKGFLDSNGCITYNGRVNNNPYNFTPYAIFYNEGKCFTTGTQWDKLKFTAYKRVLVSIETKVPTITPDVVVLDYGKAVMCSPLDNDICSTGLLGLSSTSATSYTSSYKSQNGVFKTSGNNVIFTPFSYMSSINRVKYFANFKDSKNNTKVLSSTISVIPATTVYYEDNFGGSSENGGLYIKYTGNWMTVDDSGKKTSGVTANTNVNDRQDSGEVGQGHTPYGYDGSYKNCTKFSNGTAAVAKGSISVDANGKKQFDAYAEFTFKGTGFDIISHTDIDCGMITVAVYDMDNNLKANIPVVSQDDDALYQIPAISYKGLDYGTYRVKINVNAPQKLLGITGNTFYLDAIRIYDPMGLNADDNAEFNEANDAYLQDKEANAFISSIRNYILSVGDISVDEQSGAVYVDTINNGYTNGGVLQQDKLEEFLLTGPNEEVYLTPGNGIGFALACSAVPSSVQLQIRIPAPLSDTASILVQTSDKPKSRKEITVNSATEMFYDITDAVQFVAVKESGYTYYRAVVILSNGLSSTVSDIVSVANVKLTYPSSVKNIIEGKSKDIIITSGENSRVIDENGDALEAPTTVAVGMMASWDIYCDVFDTIYTQHKASVPTYNVATNNEIVTTSCGKKVTAIFTTSQFVDNLVIKDADGNPVKAEVSSLVDEDNLYTASYESAKVWTVTFDNPTGVYNYTVAAANGEGKTAEITVNVKPAEAVLLSVLKAPAKTQYNYGEQIDPSGLELLVTYSDGTTKVVKGGYTLSTYKADRSGNRSVTVNYQGLTTSFRINVKTFFVQIILTILGMGRFWKK
ncbi:MAG: bacterial Ig-like domain-containing protein [Clostridia bacterium]|nr:bacterial Ig-like domain-containing protein [Clostridia bacterium]